MPPGGDVALNPSSVWLVDRWFRQCAALASLRVRSSYAPTDADVPAEARELLALEPDWFDAAEEGIVY